MNNLSSTTTVERRAHQQRPDPTSFAAWIDHHLSLATDAGTDLDLEVFLRPNMKFHVRITTVAGCFLTGVMLGGFRGETPRQQLGPVAFHADEILLVKRID